MATTPSSHLLGFEPPKAEPWDKADFERWLAQVREHQAAVVARRGRPFTTDEIDELLQAVREGRD